MSKRRTKLYVVLPAQGLTSEALTIKALSQSHEVLRLKDIVGDFRSASGKNRIWSSGEDVSLPFMKDSMEDDYELGEVIDSFLDDGPKLVKLSAEGERILRAGAFRLVPITKYQLQVASAPVILFSSPETGSAVAGYNDFLRTHFSEPLSSASSPKGEGVTVAVVDSGVDGNHSRLAGRVTGGRCTVQGENPLDWGACSTDKGAHGTHVAGIICAGGDPSSGPVGVAPGAKVRSYRVFPKDMSDGASNYSIIQAIRAAVEDGCDIINLSLGGRAAKDDGVRDAVNYAWVNGSVCIAAAGNDKRRPVSYPAAHHNCIAVSAIGRVGTFPPGSTGQTFVSSPFASSDQNIFLASFSNIGPQIDLTGPGVWIVSTLPNGEIGAMSGTSMASPAVAGFAAVVLSRNLNILNAKRDEQRSHAILQSVLSRSTQVGLGSFDYEGYGLPRV
ncbi:S8 family serine peptidase [Aerophototrophica crusticola]|uniref:S8 family serine peptidase n=1 Tax=Aerophototrophica crusticola TaxID=1709002 RepID=A0A858R6Z0_9PROT|nr:S8 family serine peptidase [Rhodospirillaceae bacterium B3]